MVSPHLPSRDFNKMELWGAISVNPIYQASSLGRVRNTATGRMLSLRPRKGGYVTVPITDLNGKKKRLYVHRLVVSSFLGEIPEGLEVNHINFIRHDNRLENLEILSRRRNIRHSADAGRYVENGGNTPVGSDSKASKVVESDVVMIRRMYADGIRKSVIAREFGLCQQQIKNIVSRVSWKHVN